MTAPGGVPGGDMPGYTYHYAYRVQTENKQKDV